MIQLTTTNLQLMMPGSNYDTCNTFAPLISAMWQKYGIDTALRQAHYLCQVGHESGSLHYLHELGPDSYFQKYQGRADLGNTEPGDGLRYKGRGLFETTGRFNYDSTGRELGLDLINHPELLEQPQPATDSSGLFWENHTLNIFADKDDIITITHRINGGLNGLKDRQMRLNNCKKILARV